MLLRRLRPQHLTYDPFTLDYLRDSSRLNESIHSVICCDTLQLLGGSCQISLCWILPVNKQLPSSPMKTLLSASLLTRRIDGSQFIAGEETDLMLWVQRRRVGSFTGVPVNHNGEFMRNKGLRVMVSTFPLNDALLLFLQSSYLLFLWCPLSTL